MTLLPEAPSLAEFLDAGCDLAQIPGFDPEALDLPYWIRARRPHARHEEAERCRWYALRARAGIVPPGCDGTFTHADVLTGAWTAELLDDDALAERTRPLLAQVLGRQPGQG